MQPVLTQRADCLIDEPKIGVLIPAYNEEPVINATIDSLLAAKFLPADIHIVDDRSTDHTAQLSRARGVNVFTVPVNGGKAKAQIAAFEYFDLLRQYDWVIFLDGDTKVDTNFLEEMTKAALQDPSVALFVGQVKSAKNRHIFSASRAFEYIYGQDLGKIGQHNFDCVHVAPGCASMYRTEVLKLLHIDHLTLAEDMDLTMQVHRTGGRVAYLASAVVNTQDPSTFRDYNKQTLRWYRGFWQVAIKYQIFNPFVKKQRVDWYMLLISLDAIVFNRIFCLGVIAYVIGWGAIGTALSIDFGTGGVICLYCGWRTRRWDVIWKFPVYYWISYLNLYNYIRACFEVFVFRRKLLAWNKVKRYNFDDANTVKSLFKS